MMDDHQRLLTVRAKPQRDTTQHCPQHNAHNDGRDAKRNPRKIQVLVSDFKRKMTNTMSLFKNLLIGFWKYRYLLLESRIRKQSPAFLVNIKG